ncbi:Holliday junction branch migration protein RuvA [Nesterenkonia flava]|uniref:Holliday junction branch migration complex subunit RuvA n=1 Tax=Nesterenkonia flava TaxID=469799 RepID=A0ABU1FVY5_9MICC|nr:Holliday junction branch migration protein RuvA [Nesterenkonia flava]MDR5712840.1 Holliday junction branch migration protein RuvA [Nesterenkonia flava]
MISSIRGDVLHVGLDHAVVEVSGFGMHVHATAQTLAPLRVGEEAFLFTHLAPRQDEAPLLFAFGHAEEREIFTTLLSISGVGPRLALAVLSVHTPAEVRLAIRDSDTAAFTRVPGIGKKTAQRILLELAGKLVLDEPTSQEAEHGEGASAPAVDEVTSALTSLGWTEKDAAAAVDAAVKADPEVAGAPTPVLLRTVLRGLGAKTGAAGR